ncbi:MAG: hypothetical protein V4459_12950 [Pseudomonadota bacterium]
MSDQPKTTRPAIAAAVSMLGLSLGVSGAHAQKAPPVPAGNPQGVLIGLNQPGAQTSDQIKSEQLKSQQLKSSQIKSDQIKSDQYKSSQFKSDQYKSNAYKTGQ